MKTRGNFTFVFICWLYYGVVVGQKNRDILTPQHENKHNIIGNSSLSPAWLKDLLDSYNIAFPRQFGFYLKFKTKSIPPNLNKWRDKVGICQNVSFFSVEQNKRLFGRFGLDKTLNDTIHNMITNPRARLYRFDNLRGEFEDYNFADSKRRGMCTDLKKLSRNVNSVFTFGKCIRLFEYTNCFGHSKAVYPGSSNANKLSQSKPIPLQSIGPCFGNEFSGGSFDKTNPIFVIKNPELRRFSPDVILLLNNTQLLDRRSSFKSFNDIKYKFALGPKNRTESILTVFGNSPANASRYGWTPDEAIENGDGDVVGYAIPPNFGGPTTQAFNQFLKSRAAIFEWDHVLSRLARGQLHFLVFQFEYENSNKSRPLFFYYHAPFRHETYYGRIITSHSNERREQPYNPRTTKSKGAVGTDLRKYHQLYLNISTKTEPKNSSSNFAHNFNQNNSIPTMYLTSCQRETFSSNSEVGNNNSLKLDAAIQEMFHRPFVRLFSGTNFSGDFEDYHYGKVDVRKYTEGCYDVMKARSVKSAQTFGKCIRLFDSTQCKGSSLAIYSGSDQSYRTTDKELIKVRSVGPCLPDEFTNASFSGKFNNQVVKGRGKLSFVSDLLFKKFSVERREDLRYFFRDEFGNTKPFWATVDPFYGSGLQVLYGLDFSNRTQQIVAKIDRVGPVVNEKFENLEELDFYKYLDKEEGDVPCLAIPLAFGGLANQSWNVFPTSQSKCDDWAQIFPTSISDPNELINFEVIVSFAYENELTTKPTFVYYHFHLLSPLFHFRIYYGRFINYSQ